MGVPPILFQNSKGIVLAHFQDIRQAIENAGKIQILRFLEMSRN